MTNSLIVHFGTKAEVRIHLILGGKTPDGVRLIAQLAAKLDSILVILMNLVVDAVILSLNFNKNNG
jgi:hypothetical protein